MVARTISEAYESGATESKGVADAGDACRMAAQWQLVQVDSRPTGTASTMSEVDGSIHRDCVDHKYYIIVVVT